MSTEQTQGGRIPRGNAQQQTTPNTVGEDRSKAGWPGLSERPFVEPSYYDQFPATCRPKFDMGGQTSLALAIDEAERLRKVWADPFQLITVVNLTDTEWSTTIVGPTPGSLVGVLVPPFGVLRGVLQQELSTRVSGSRFTLRRPIAAAGECSLDPEEQRMTRIEHTDGRPSEFIGGCHRYGCTQPGHWRADLPFVHSVRQAQSFCASVGEALASMDDPLHKASYIPVLDEKKRGPQARLWAFKNRDPRPDVMVFLAHRLDYLVSREAAIKVRADKGIGTAGR